MENGDEIVGDGISKEEDGTDKGLLSEGLSGSHITNGEQYDSAKNEVFEDTMTDAEGIYTPQHLDATGLKNALFFKLDSGNNGDLTLEQQLEVSTGVQVNDQIFENDKLIFPEVFEPITTNSLNNDDIYFGQIESDAANETVCSPENRNCSNFSSSAALCADNCTGDSQSLNVSVETEEYYFLSQKLADPLGKETTEYSENDSKAIVATYSVQSHDREIVFAPDNENFGGENPENGVIDDNASFYKSCVEEFESGDDILNKYEVEEIQNVSIDEIREDNIVQVKADSLLAEEGSAYSVVTSENEEPLEQESRPILESRSNGKEDTPRESDLIEDISELSSTEDDENSNHQTPPSHSRLEPSVALSLPSHPSGLGPSSPLEPASRPLQHSRANESVPRKKTMISEDSITDAIEESDEISKKLQMIRVKFLRIAYRLGQTPHNEIVAQALYLLGFTEQVTRKTNSQGVFSIDRACVMAEQLEASGLEPLDFTCTILVIGKTGVGKSATINSIFDDAKLRTDAFQLGTKKSQVIVGTVQGINIRAIDTPGLSSYPSDKHRNEKILNSIKRFISKTPPDIILYVDRLDMRNRDFGDVPLLRTVTDVFGASIWFKTIVVFTHACTAPPDGPNGNPLSYEMFVTLRSHFVQQAIRQAAGDLLLMNPMSLVENHSSCRKNKAGQRVLPNGQVWKQQLLLLSFASMIRHESNILLKLDDRPTGIYSRSRARTPPLPYFLTSLIQSRPHLKLQEEQMDDEDSMFEDLEETSEEDDESDYDELPPFKSLTKSRLAKLSKAQRKAYFEELDYREKLFFKKQRKENKKRRELLKKMTESVPDSPIDHNGENAEDNSGVPEAITRPLPDFPLPNSFDSDNPAHHFRFDESSTKRHVFPVLETQGWDHDVGYDGLYVKRLFAIKNKIPLSISGQLKKDKKDCTLHMEVASSVKHNEATTSSVGFDMESAGTDMVYTLRGETKFKNFRCNNTAAGLSVTVLGDSISAGVKFEDKLLLSKRISMVISGGAMTARGDVAYGGRLEAILRDKNYPIGRGLSSVSLTAVDWHNDLALGCNIQSQHPIGRETNVIFHGNLSNKGSGQVGIRLNTSDHLQMALILLLPILRNAIRALFTSFEPL